MKNLKLTFTRIAYALLTFIVCYIICAFVFVDLFWVYKIQKFGREERLLLLGIFAIAQAKTQLFISTKNLIEK